MSPVAAPPPTQYDAVAEAYEARVVPRFRPIADALLGAAEIAPGERVVEVGAGTGGLSRLVAGRLGPSGSLLLTDVSTRMLELARELVPSGPGGPRITIEPADLRHIPAPNGAFDRYLALLTPAQDRIEGLAEAHRVLAAGGRLAIAFWGRGYAEAELLNAVRRDVGLPSSVAIARSTVVGRLRRIGFASVRSRTVRLPVTHESVEAYLRYRQAFGNVGDVSPDTVRRAEAALRRRAERIAPDGGPVVLDWTIVVVTATRP